MNTEHKQKAGNRISRRTFINRAALGAAAMALTPATSLLAANRHQSGSWPSDASGYKFYMIGHGHLDPIWLWTWPEGVAVVHSTFRSALDRMNETAEVVFTSSSAQFYQWVADHDPKMLGEIRKRVNEGRWNIVGGWWIEPDMNIPSGEAMVRQGLYGQLTLQRLFGRKATTAFNPDSFGHTGSLPQIIKQQGMENYVFERPGTHEKTLPSELFWWEGIDGTRVMAYRIQYTYELDHNREGAGKDRILRVLKDFGNRPVKNFMLFYGMGDHGGGPTKENIRLINGMKAEQGAPVIVHSTVDRYFADARADKNLQIPTVRDDLQHHAVGCYTAEWEIKKGNCQSEAALVTTEKITAIGAIAWGVNYPKKELTTAWQKVLFLQFHDSLAGTSIYEHSQDAREGFGFAMETARNAMYLAIQKLEWQIASEDPDSDYMVVFNPHAWEVKGNVAYDYGWQRTWDEATSRVVDENGNPYPHQLLPASTEAGRIKLLTRVVIPPMGYRQIRLMKGEGYRFANTVKMENNVIENEFYRIRFSKNGTVGILDKETEKEVFTKGDNGCRAVVIDDPSDTWSHGVKSYADEIGMFGNAAVKPLEKGPLRATVRVTSSYHLSTLTIDWSLTAGSRSIEANVTLDWHERLKALKFSFPVDVTSPKATYEVPYGNIARETNGQEDPGLRWIDLTGQRGGSAYGLTVFNDAKYGYSVDGSDMRVTIARAPVFAHHEPTPLLPEREYRWMEQGIQSFRMLLVPHRDSWKESGIVRIKEEFMSPLVAIYQGIHPGTMAKSGSFLAMDSANVVVAAVKQAEDGADLIIRCVETSGVSTTAATLDLRFVSRKWTGDFRPYEIKSLRVNPKTGVVREVNLLEESVKA